MKLKSFRKAKFTITWIKSGSYKMGNIITTSTSNKGLISKLYKEPRKLDTKEIIQCKSGIQISTECSQ